MTVEELKQWGKDSLPGLVGFEIAAIEAGKLNARMAVRPELLAPNGFLHAASIIALADTACGYGTTFDLPEGAKNFTTIELKANFLGTATEGILSCEATRVHGGRTTQVWDAVVRNDAGKAIALFRCTQILLR
jgi:1,4-dihydroxy-2-naphthoyl-CoA hydrolase